MGVHPLINFRQPLHISLVLRLSPGKHLVDVTNKGTGPNDPLKNSLTGDLISPTLEIVSFLLFKGSFLVMVESASVNQSSDLVDCAALRFYLKDLKTFIVFPFF